MTAIPIGSRCLIVSGFKVAPHLIGRECIIVASYTRGTSPTAWYRARTNDGVMVTGPPSAFCVVSPYPRQVTDKPEG